MNDRLGKLKKRRMIKLKSVIYLISMMTLAGCSGQKQASVAVEEQSGQWILGLLSARKGESGDFPATDYFPMPDAQAAGKMGRE